MSLLQLFQRHSLTCSIHDIDMWSAIPSLGFQTGDVEFTFYYMIWDLTQVIILNDIYFGFLSNASSYLTAGILLQVIDIHCIFSPSGWLKHQAYLLCLLLFLDPIGKRDEHEPLTDTVQSDSAVIGGNLSSLLKAGKISIILFSTESCLKPSLPMIIQFPESGTLCSALCLFRHGRN